MEQTPKPSTRQTPREEDVDLGHLFYKTGGAINNFFLWMGKIFTELANMVLLFLFFLRRNLMWLLVGTALGVGYGFYVLSKEGSNYFSSMTVQANYNSSRALYSSMDYFNALIGSRQRKELAKTFNITEPEAASLIYFESNPVVTELIAADLYKNRFLNLYHNTRLRMDTFWVKTISYKDFKSSLTKYDYPIHQVKVTSTNATVFRKLQDGIIRQVSSNELLQLEKKNGVASNQQEVQLLESSLKSLDTLRDSYNKRLAATGPSKEGNNVTLLDGNLTAANPELQLYDKMLQLKDELKMVRSQAVIENDILQVYAPFSSVGQSAGLLENKIFKYAYIGTLMALIIILVIALYKYLGTLETKHARNRNAAKGF